MFSQEYFAIPSSIIRSGVILDFELYRREQAKGKDKYELAFSERLPVITQEALDGLRKNGIEILHIAKSEAARYRAYLERNLRRIIEDPWLSDREKARVLYYAAKVHVREWFSNPRVGSALESSIEVIHSIIKQVLKSEHAFYSFFDLNGDSPYFLSHSLNVAIYGVALLNAMGNNQFDTIEAYAYGALMHDLGMREVPNEIITKPDKLTPEEYKVVRKHPSTGAKIVTTAVSLPPQANLIVGQHHERLNGKGYPWGLGTEEIHPLARVCAVADVFDALTSPRIYREPVNTFDAFRIMKFKESGNFDSSILDVFIRLMTK